MDAKTIERLFFVRYLYATAERQTGLSRPMCYSSVLTFQDSVELFLQIVAEEVGAEVKKDIRFLDYWPKINEKLAGRNESLGSEQAMMRLNGSRVELKHHGTPVAEPAVSEYRVEVLDFFRDNCPKVFGIDFEEISLVGAVDFAPSREKLKSAERLAANHEFKAAIDATAISFELLIGEYVNRSSDRWHDSPFAFGRDLRYGVQDTRGFEAIGAKDFAESVLKTLTAVQEAMRIISFGLDFRRYTRFKQLTPMIHWTLGSTEPILVNRSGAEEAEGEQYWFCIDFVLESALRLQEAFPTEEGAMSSKPA